MTEKTVQEKRREFTDEEAEHVATLRRRCNVSTLAEHAGIPVKTLQSSLGRGVLTDSMIAKLMAVKLENVPRKEKPKKFKPGPLNNIFFPKGKKDTRGEYRPTARAYET